jgi:nitrogen fixation-related uncharacterized protein
MAPIAIILLPASASCFSLALQVFLWVRWDGQPNISHHEDHEVHEGSDTILIFLSFVPFASFVVKTILSSLVVAILLSRHRDA